MARCSAQLEVEMSITRYLSRRRSAPLTLLVAIVLLGGRASVAETPAETPDEAIRRIQAGRHTPMPAPATAPATGPTGKGMTIENGTGHILHVYFSGPISRTVVVPDGKSESVELAVGAYQVAAEVPGSRIEPFYGRHAYQPFTHYWLKFYTKAVQRDSPVVGPSPSGPSPATVPPEPVRGFRFAIEVQRQAVLVSFGEREALVKQTLGPPEKIHDLPNYQPRGIMRVLHYPFAQFLFDSDRLATVTLGHEYKGGFHLQAAEKYTLMDAVRIGDAFEKIERLLRTLANRLEVHYGMQPLVWGPRGQAVPTGSSDYALSIDDSRQFAWISIEHKGAKVSYRFVFADGRVTSMVIGVGKYRSDYIYSIR